METNTKTIIFDLPEDTTSASIIEQILKSNGLEESDEEFSSKDENGIEPRFTIIRDSIFAMVGKKIPNEKLIEILVKHLEISEEVAKKIIQDISEQLIPFAKMIDLEEESMAQESKPGQYDKEKYKEDLLNKIKSNKSVPILNKEESLMPYKKAPTIGNAEQNAQKIEQERKPIVSENNTPEKPQPKIESKPDPYKEPIE